MKRRTVSALLGILLMAAAAVAQDGPEFDDDVLEITPDVLERFIAAADTEAKERERGLAADPRLVKAAGRAACLKPHRDRLDAVGDVPAEEYRRIVDRMWEECAPDERPGGGQAVDVQGWMACVTQLQAEAEAHMEAYVAAQGQGDVAAAQRHLAAMEAIQNSVVERCGSEPSNDDFLDAAGVTREPPDPFDDPEVGQAIWEVEQRAEERAAEAGRFTARQYGVVRERVQAFLTRSLEDNRLRRYLFAPDEIRAMEASRPRLARAIEALGLDAPGEG